MRPRVLLALALVLLALPATARAQAPYETSLIPAAVTFAAAGSTENATFDAGTGANRTLIVAVFWRDRENTISGVTYNGVAMTSQGAKVTSNLTLSGQLFALGNPASGSNVIAVTMGAGSGTSPALIGAWVANSTDAAGTPTDGFASNFGNGATANIQSTVTVASATNDRAVVFHGTFNASANLTATPTNYTERQDGNNAGGLSLEYGDADGAASIATTATWNNGAFQVDWVALGVNVNQSVGGAAARPCCLGVW